MDRTTPTEPTDDVGRVRAFREALASLLDEDGRPKSAEAVGDEDDDIAITSGHAVRAFVATLTPPVTRTAGEADALADEVGRIAVARRLGLLDTECGTLLKAAAALRKQVVPQQG